MLRAGAPVHPSAMVTAIRLPLLGLGALLAAIYTLVLIVAIRGVPSSAIGIGLALDLTVTATAATWWLGVRRGGLSRRAPFVVLAAGALAARFVLAAEASRVAFGMVLALELGLIALITVRARHLIRGMRRRAGLPLIVRLADSLEEIGVPRRVARILTTEIATTGLALTGWFRRAPRDGFSVHRTHVSLAMHAVMVLLIAVETLALHLLLARVTAVGAWISTGLSIYAVLWVIGDAHALRLGRIRIEHDQIVIEVARRWAAVIPRRVIAAVHRETAVRPGALDLAIETPTVMLELSAPVTARGPFGLTRSGARVALTIDDPEGFVAALER